jgi:hypothetical protein
MYVAQKQDYRSFLTLKPGPAGGVDNEVNLPNGSAAYLALLGPLPSYYKLVFPIYTQYK